MAHAAAAHKEENDRLTHVDALPVGKRHAMGDNVDVHVRRGKQSNAQSPIRARKPAL